MNKAVLMSFQPQGGCKILNSEKTIEVRTRFPKDYRGWVYMYITKGKPYLYRFSIDDRYSLCPHKSEKLIQQYEDFKFFNGKVVARFWCDKVEEIKWFPRFARNVDYYTNEPIENDEKELLKNSCLSFNELDNYLKGKNGCAIHISKLEVFDRPKELWQFEKYGSYTRKDIKCKNKDRGICNRGWGLKGYSGCEKARLTKAPQSWQYVEE